MATDINNLTKVTGVQSDDLFPIFDRSNSATRAVSLNNLNASLGTIKAVRFVAPNLIIETNDNQTFTVDISTP